MKKKKQTKNQIFRNAGFFLLGILSMLLIFTIISLLEKPLFEEEIHETIKIEIGVEEIEKKLSLDEYLEIEVELTRDFIILKDKESPCDGMVVAIESSQAFSIQRGIDSEVGVRPTSHDTIRDILEQYNIEVVMVKITELKGGAYFGRLILKTDDKISNLDVRPSDGIGIAVRKNSPIYISQKLFEEYMEDVC